MNGDSKIVRATSENLERAAQILLEGGLVAFPTETVYGLGAHGLREDATAKIYEAKGRPSNNPLILHLADASWLDEIAHIGATGRLLEQTEALSSLWPGPLTLVLPAHDRVPMTVRAGRPSIAVRVPNHNIALQLLDEVGVPIAAPSANPSGYVSPTTAEHVQDQLGDRVQMILDGGETPVGIESTIVSLLDEVPRVLRHGGVPLEELEHRLGKVEIADSRSAEVIAPGMSPEHYAPRTPLYLSTDPDLPQSGRVALLSCIPRNSSAPDVYHTVIRNLPWDSKYQQAARALFAALRDLDRAGFDAIVVAPYEELWFGRAIMDRLRRARKGSHGPA